MKLEAFLVCGFLFRGRGGQSGSGRWTEQGLQGTEPLPVGDHGI